jgi:hypothetical protein
VLDVVVEDEESPVGVDLVDEEVLVREVCFPRLLVVIRLEVVDDESHELVVWDHGYDDIQE